LVTIVSVKKPSKYGWSNVRFLSLEDHRRFLLRLEGLAFVGQFLRYARFLLLVMKTGASIIHCHELDAAWIALLACCFRRPCKIIYEVREWFPEIVVRRTTSLVMRRLHRFFLKAADIMASKRVSAIVSVEEPKARRYKIYVRGSIPVLTIENYPRTDLFSPSKERRRMPDAGITGLYSGGISLDRGLEEMLWLTRRINDSGYDFTLILNGTFVDLESRRSYGRLVETYGVAGKVWCTGWVPHHVVPNYVRQADICFAILYPTEIYFRSLPIKIFEYMACARPIIASDLPLISEVVKGSRCGLVVKPADRASLLDAALLLVRDESLRESLGLNGLTAVKEKYNWSFSEISLLNLYSSLLRSNAGTCDWPMLAGQIPN
jgi:glycosyltransferase involved in cell wall biosynthesis